MMTMIELGVPTYHTRVERWECDYNDHWNARYYGRSFQMAAETVRSMTVASSASDASSLSRQIRFHRELFVSAPVEVRSARVGSGEMHGAIVHLLLSAGELAASAIDMPGGAAHLPWVSSEDVPLAMPRGINPLQQSDWREPGSPGVTASLGPISPHELDHRGNLLFEHVIRHNSVTSHMLLDRLGLIEYSRRTGINRMGIEFLVRQEGTPAAGTSLYGQAKLLRASGKRFWISHRTYTTEDKTVSTIEQCLVTVDLATRRAVEVPELLHAALAGHPR